MYITGDSSVQLTIISANVRGLRQPLKRLDFWDKFRDLKADIILLQETHLVELDLNDLKKEWNVEFHIAGTSSNSRGVAIIINNSFEYHVQKSYLDPEGRFLILSLYIANLYTVTITNVYGPNKDDPGWYEGLFEKVNSFENSDYFIYAGDWNMSLTEMDFYNYNSHRNLKAFSQVQSGNSESNRHLETAESRCKKIYMGD